MKNKTITKNVRGHKIIFKRVNAEKLVLEQSALGLCSLEADGSIVITLGGEPTRQVIAHELFHAFIKIHIGDIQLRSRDDFEEICCHIVENNIDLIMSLREEIYERFRSTTKSIT